MVLSEEQKKLIETDGAEPAKKSTAKRVNNSRELYAKVLDINTAVEGTLSQIKDTNGSMMNTMEQVRATNEAVAVGLIEVKDDLEKLSDATIFLMDRLDKMQGGAVPAPQPAAPAETAPAEGISRDTLDNFKKQISARDAELANKKFSNLMEKMCLMREDYAALCRNMRRDLATFSPAEVLGSFEAYLIDMENMLYDAGISIGPYGKDGDQVDVAHQRIVGVVTTSDPSKNGTVAARLTDGYEYNGRALVKEKVNVYKVAEQAPEKKPEEEDEIVEILG